MAAEAHTGPHTAVVARHRAIWPIITDALGAYRHAIAAHYGTPAHLWATQHMNAGQMEAALIRKGQLPGRPRPLFMWAFRAPSGRLHYLANCSGGPGKRGMQSVKLSLAEWETGQRCRCLHTWMPEEAHL